MILVVGTLPPPICGTTVSLKHLCDSLEQEQDVELHVLDTGSIRHGGVKGVLKFLGLLKSLISYSRRMDVVTLHLNPTAIHILCPFAFLSRMMFKTKVVLRLFGGEDVTEFSGLHAFLFRWSINRSDLYLAQTKAMVAANQQRGVKHVEWFPTSRPLDSNHAQLNPKTKCRKFVSIGWVKKSKGVPIAIEAAEKFDPEVSVDFYGPFDEGMSESDFIGLKNCRYCGIIPAGKAVEVMRDYDALLFPTFWAGEGYPGIVLEAFQAGLPVIATDWRSIPELVDDRCGILVPINDPEAVQNAMRQLIQDESLFQKLQQGAFLKGRDFSSQQWNATFVEHCRVLIDRP